MYVMSYTVCLTVLRASFYISAFSGVLCFAISWVLLFVCFSSYEYIISADFIVLSEIVSVILFTYLCLLF